jgi:hypothetical protein
MNQPNEFTKKAILVFGYNNTRVYDIERIVQIAQNDYNACVVLCKDQITDIDKKLTPYTLEVRLEFAVMDHMNELCEQIDKYMLNNQLQAIGCLPFSDKGVPLGSYYADYKQLPCDDPKLAFAGIDKHCFRQLEQQKIYTPLWYKKPLFYKVNSIEQVEKIIKQECSNNGNTQNNINTDNSISGTAKSFFIKPVAEGNSRGCIEIGNINDLQHNAKLLNQYAATGLIVEECIKHSQEFSFDGVGDFHVITEKMTSRGRYRVETQHILPAPISPDCYSRLMQAGHIVSELVGSRGGAIHNELFLDYRNGSVYCVEPNRRPAGLKLWDWIKIAYPEVDCWQQWLDWAVGAEYKFNISSSSSSSIQMPTTFPIKNRYFVGCRMLQSSRAGVLKNMASITSQLSTLRNDECIVEINITKKDNESITNKLKDNSDFIGYVVCKHEDSNALRKLLDYYQVVIEEELFLPNVY